MLAVGSLQEHAAHVTTWAAEIKGSVDQALLQFLFSRKSDLSFALPASLQLLAPLAIRTAASGAALSAFREVMNYDNLVASFQATGQYEAAGTVWMLDPVSDVVQDTVTVSQLESAASLWSEATFRMSAVQESARRFSFDIPFPASLPAAQVAVRQSAGSTAVLLAQAAPMLAGRAQVLAWYSAVSGALRENDQGRVFKLLEAGLSVPIRLRLNPDDDTRLLAALSFSENVFASAAASGADSFWWFATKAAGLVSLKKSLSTGDSVPKMLKIMQGYGLTFKGKPVTDTNAKALKNLAPSSAMPSVGWHSRSWKRYAQSSASPLSCCASRSSAPGRPVVPATTQPLARALR